MSKYIKLEDALKGLNIGYGKYDYVSKVAEYYHDLPTIEVNEDCISRKALLKQIYADSEGKEGGYGDEWEFIDTINNLPSVVPSRATGKWQITINEDYRCENCGLITSSYKANYCPYCGARME